MIRMYSDEQVLDLKFRQQVIGEIQSGENATRRAESLRRQDIYRGNTKQHVLMSLLAEGLKPQTVQGILARTPNIRICGKIIDKKARAYNSGVKREANTDELTQKLETMMRLLNFDGRMRTADRYRELHKNCLLQIVPQISNGNPDEPVYSLIMRAYAPHEYDVIEDCFDKEKPRCVILSDFIEQERNDVAATEHDAGLHPAGIGSTPRNFNDGILADTPSDSGMGRKRVFVWWTAEHHFMTDAEGEIIAAHSPDNNENPIGLLPFVVNAESQDGKFWAQGGADVVDSHVIINKQIGDMNYIAYLQGFGQYVVTGRNLKDQLEIGPASAIMIDYTQDDPKPEVTVVSADPPLDSWMRMIEQHVALLLTTNDLSAGHVAGTLTANTFPSGVAMLIEQSESTVGVEDKQTEYVAIEAALFAIMAAWQNHLLGQIQIDEAWAVLGALPEDFAVVSRFNEVKVVVTETERLTALKLRKELGIVEDVDLVLADNPGMTREDALKKLDAIRKEREAKAPALGGAPKPGEGKPEPKEGDDGNDADDDKGESA